MAKILPVVPSWNHLIQCTSKPTKRLRRPAKALIRLRIRAVWSEPSLIACAFFCLQTLQRGTNDNPCYTGGGCTLIWVFAGHTGLIVGLVVRWFIYENQLSRTACASVQFGQIFWFLLKYMENINDLHVFERKQKYMSYTCPIPTYGSMTNSW